MTEKEGDSHEREVGGNDCGVILGYWDHEETPTLIQVIVKALTTPQDFMELSRDLEHSVDSVERKCKNLLEELMYYKKYLEESEGPQVHLAVLKKNNKISKNRNFCSGSDPDITFRKNLINLQETQQVFEEKFQEKLFNINKELRAAAHKLGLRDSIILFPTDSYLKNLRKQTEHRARKSWSEVRDRFIKLNRFKPKTKSESVIFDIGNDEQVARITRNELELYQQLSRLSFKKTAGLKSKNRRKIKFCCGKKTPKFRGDSQEPDSKQKSSKKRRKKAPTPPKVPRPSPENPPTDHNPPEPTTKSPEENLHLGMPIRKTIPFTVCASTSRSCNIGLNMQQLLSLQKQGLKSNARVVRQGEEGSTFRKGRSSGEVEKRHSVSELDGKVWVSERRTSSNLRKARCKYTDSPPGRVMEYHKSTMSRYTDGQKAMIKSESESAYAVGSKIMVSGCERTDVFEMGQRASGDGVREAKVANPNMEWSKVYSSFLDTCRKYMSLKEKLSNKDSAPSSDELKSLEKEIDCAIEKYKDFLQFYGKFLHLKHRLRCLKIACVTKQFGASSNCQYYRPTCAMAMKRAFKEVRALQEKISLVSD